MTNQIGSVDSDARPTIPAVRFCVQRTDIDQMNQQPGDYLALSLNPLSSLVWEAWCDADGAGPH